MQQIKVPTKEDLANAYGSSQHAGHRSPREAGSADRYYGRPYIPSFAFNNQTFRQEAMTAEQLAQYDAGYWNETDRKDWGFSAKLTEEMVEA